jgi:hypothetical protein
MKISTFGTGKLLDLNKVLSILRSALCKFLIHRERIMDSGYTLFRALI